MVGPFFHYLGSKHRISRAMPPPKHGLIIEPFAGSAGYSCIYHDRDVLLRENSATIVQLWSWLIHASRSDILDIPVLPHGARIDQLDIPVEAKMMLGFFSVPGVRGHMRVSKFNSWTATMRARLAEDVLKIKHWKVELGDYASSPDVEATWVIDPPYQHVNAVYVGGTRDSISFPHLAKFCRSRRGQVFVHEQAGADWLPFSPLVTVQSASRGGSKARGRTFKSEEVLWSNDCDQTSAMRAMLATEA